MKKLSLMIVISMIGVFTFAAVQGQGGSGGAVVKQHGVYMSFYSAGLYVEPNQGDMTTIPGLFADLKYIRHLPYLGFKSRSTVLDALTPSDKRHYYIAVPNALTATINARLLDEFKHVTGVDVSHLHLAAITDTNSGTTFILPPFFKLKPDDQMALLFHESYWIMHPATSYNEVVRAEMAFEAALESPNDFVRVYDFVSRVGNRSEVFKAAMTADLSTGALYGLTKYDTEANPLNSAPGSDEYISMNDLLGADTIECMKEDGGYNSTGVSSDQYDDNNTTWGKIPPNCSAVWQTQLVLLQHEHPRSAVLKMLNQWLESARKDQCEKDDDSSSWTPSVGLFYDQPYYSSSWTPIPRLTEAPIKVMDIYPFIDENGISIPIPFRKITDCRWFVSSSKSLNLLRCYGTNRYGDEVQGLGNNTDETTITQITYYLRTSTIGFIQWLDGEYDPCND